MSESPLAYIPTDRRHAMARGDDLPRRTHGAALFADISGFTPLTEALVHAHGAQRGAEQLLVELNRIYDALVARLDDQRGSVITYSGDAMTCWFDDDGDGGWRTGSMPSAVERALTCAAAMQSAMDDLAVIEIPGAGSVTMAIKIAIATGPVVRYVVGDPEIQVIDVMAGATIERLAAAEHLAEPGDIIVDAPSHLALGIGVEVIEWRRDDHDEPYAVVLPHQHRTVPPDPWPALADDAVPQELVDTWLIPPVVARMRTGMGEFLTELRPAVSLFLRFEGIEYDHDPDAEQQLDRFVRAVQTVLHRFESYILQITIGDKGSYINTAFGAPVAHGDDAQRAAAAALELRELDVPPLAPVQVGIAQGRTRTGACGGTTRRQYGVMGDEVNLSARLMTRARPDEILADPSVRRSTESTMVWEDLESFTPKGKSQPIVPARLLAARDHHATQLHLPDYALPVVGRQAELDVIVARLDVALGGRGQVMGIVAEAGMGKSRLLAEVLRTVQHPDLLEFAGECQSYGVNAPYLVWHAIWRAFFGLDPAMSVAGQIGHLERELRQIDPLLAERAPLLGAAVNLPIPDNELTESFDAALRKTSLESLLVRCVRERARTNPLLLVLEDCHWLDPLSHDLLEVIGRAITDVPVMIITALRPDLASHLETPKLSRLPHYTEVTLGELPPSELAALIASKLRQLYGPATQPQPDLVEELSSRSQGNPFYLEELLNYLKDRGVDPSEPDVLDRLQLPDSLYSLILGRIDQLTEDQRTVLKVASVIGRLFQVAMLYGVYPSSAEHTLLLQDLATLAVMDLTALDTPEPELAYLFKHVLTQEVAYETLPFATRAVLHDQIGQFLEAQYTDTGELHLDLLAHHYDRSENQPKRREFLRRAGDAARATSANLSAISYYERVLPLLVDHDRAEVLLDLGQVLETVGEWSRAEVVDRQALGLADQLGDIARRARAQQALGVLCRKRGEYADAIEWSAAARDSYERGGDPAGMSHAVADIGEVHRLQGRYVDARANYDHSLEIANRVDDDERRAAATAHALKGAGTVATWQGDYQAARSLNQQSLDLRRRLADKPGVAVLLNNQGIIARFQHDLDVARRMNDESLALFREIGDQWAVGQLLNNQACVAADQGEYDEAQVLLHESLTIRRQLGDRSGLALSLNTLADVLIDIDRPAEAEPILAESLAIDIELGDSTAIAYLLEDYAGVAAAYRQHVRALRLAGFAAALREQIGAPLPPNELARVERIIAPARLALDADAAALAWEEGRQWSEGEAVAEASRVAADGPAIR